MDEVIGLFPTPLLRVPGVLDRTLVAGLVAHFSARATTANNASTSLSHTEMLQPGDSPLLVQVATTILAYPGVILFCARIQRGFAGGA